MPDDASGARPPNDVLTPPGGAAAFLPSATRTLVGALRAASGPVPTIAVGWLAAVALAVLHDAANGLLIALGFGGAVLAGLVGIGGAIVMIPLLLYVPPLAGVAPLGMRAVAGATMVQVAAAGLAGMLGHLAQGGWDGRLVLVLGGAMTLGSLAGALASSVVSAAGLTVVFVALALAAAGLMLGRRRVPPELEAGARLAFNTPLAAILGVVTGMLVGLVGAGGGFLLVPLMLYVLRVPMRIAVGSSLGIVTMGALAGAAGKAATGQVPWEMALALVAGAIPGARLGASWSRKLRTETLAVVLGVLIAVIAVRMGVGVLVGE